MKTTLILTFAAALAFTALPSLGTAEEATKPKASATAQKYTCEMHPEVISDKPGKCPKCGMNLTPVKPKK